MGDDIEPGGDPDRDAGEDPFKGTPMEGLFAAFGGPGGVMGGGHMPDLSALVNQMQQMFQPHDGPINFAMAKDVARQAAAAAGADPTPHAGQAGAVNDAVQLAEGWLDRATSIPAGATSAVAWSRADWIDQTTATWQTLIEPVATHVIGAMGEALPEETKAMAGPLVGMLTQVGGAIFGQQIGQALAGLAGEVVSSTDIGFPLGPERTVAILPTNVTAFGEGLEHRPADVLLYVTLRECAHHRLFHHAPWLRGAVLNAIEEFARNTRIDVSGIEEKLAGLDPSQLPQAMESGLFEPERTAEQQAAVERLETLLAFIEGWVDDVVAEATRDVMPASVALAEAMRRRRAAGGPAEQTFASLVGLELRPRRLRDAATLWAALRDRFGADARDAVWTHPDLMPTAADLDDPLGFTPQDVDADFDAAVGELLDQDRSEPGEE
ncbi:MAG TPA: zinc-dependent metalloprotease [Aeromicrobium sp.]|nr:zinc-dependent metalloprotease [Aeromicrobium sp.]